MLKRRTSNPAVAMLAVSALLAGGGVDQIMAATHKAVITPASSAQAPLPEELAALDAQFMTLQAERATAPYDASLERLNNSYLNSIAEKIIEEKAAANLDGILALEAEQKLLAIKMPVPESDSENTPASLKALRAIYREAHARLAATRAASLNSLAAPLEKRLAEMEAYFVKSDRIADAKIVREYREALKTSSAALSLNASFESPANPAAMLPLRDGYTNSIGMKFVAVKGTEVLFCIHETRHKDYAAYAAAAPGISANWENQTHDGHPLAERPEDHPVVNVSWLEAKAFCAWLSAKEGKTYRLPTDQEWSIAVGIGRDEKWDKTTTPATVSISRGTYPWGDKWPPPEGAGNYSDESRKRKAPRADEQYIGRYDDGFPTTAPVMSFKPNKLGLYDMGGNVLEWCEDWYDDAKRHRVLRGSSWGRHDQNNLLSSFRRRVTPDARSNYDGFRIVLVLPRD